MSATNTFLEKDKVEAILHLQLKQYTYRLHSENVCLPQGTLSFHLLQSSSSGQISLVQGEYEVCLLSILHLCFGAI